jgi:hypothetical protein
VNSLKKIWDKYIETKKIIFDDMSDINEYFSSIKCSKVKKYRDNYLVHNNYAFHHINFSEIDLELDVIIKFYSKLSRFTHAPIMSPLKCQNEIYDNHLGKIFAYNVIKQMINKREEYLEKIVDKHIIW